VGVSADHPATLDAFTKQNGVKHLLLADFRRQMLPQYDALETNDSAVAVLGDDELRGEIDAQSAKARSRASMPCGRNAGAMRQVPARPTSHGEARRATPHGGHGSLHVRIDVDRQHFV